MVYLKHRQERYNRGKDRQYVEKKTSSKVFLLLTVIVVLVLVGTFVYLVR